MKRKLNFLSLMLLLFFASGQLNATVVDLTGSTDSGILKTTLSSPTYAEGDTILLARGMEYDITSTTISVGVVIMSAEGAGDPAVLNPAGSSLNVAAGVTLGILKFVDVEVKGDIANGYLMNIANSSNVTEFVLDGVYIHNLRGVFRAKTSDVNIGSFAILNSVVDSIGTYGVMIMDNATASCPVVTYSNSVFSNSYQLMRWRDAINVSALTITDCSINNSPSSDNSGYLIRVEGTAPTVPLEISNTIFGLSNDRLKSGTVTINCTNCVATSDCALTGFDVAPKAYAGTAAELWTAPTTNGGLDFSFLDAAYAGREVTGIIGSRVNITDYNWNGSVSSDYNDADNYEEWSTPNGNWEIIHYANVTSTLDHSTNEISNGYSFGMHLDGGAVITLNNYYQADKLIFSGDSTDRLTIGNGGHVNMRNDANGNFDDAVVTVLDGGYWEGKANYIRIGRGSAAENYPVVNAFGGEIDIFKSHVGTSSPGGVILNCKNGGVVNFNTGWLDANNILVHPEDGWLIVRSSDTLISSISPNLPAYYRLEVGETVPDLFAMFASGSDVYKATITVTQTPAVGAVYAGEEFVVSATDFYGNNITKTLTVPQVLTPPGPATLNNLVTRIGNGDIIELLSPADLAVDSAYVFTATFNIGDKDITVRPANIANGMPQISATGGNFQTSTGSFYMDNIEYTGGNYVLRVSGNVNEIEITNCNIQNVGRGVILQTSGGRNINNAVIDNCIIINCGGGDNNPVFGTNTTSGYYGSFSLTNSTLSKIKGPVFRITHKLTDDTKILVDHCTIDSIYGTTSPFYSSTNVTDLTGNEVTISNTVLSNVFDCTSLWSRLTIATPENCNIGTTSYWNVGAAVDSAVSTTVTLAATYVNADPEYTAYTEDVTARDFSINNSVLLKLGTDGKKIGDPRWTNQLVSIWTPKGPFELNKLAGLIASGDIIELLSPADLAVDSTYAFTTTFNIGDKSVIVRPANLANGRPYIDASGGNFQTSTGSFSLDNVDYNGGNYVLRVSGNVPEIKITNCNISNVGRGVILQTSGGRNIDNAVVDNCLIINCGGGDNNPVFGTNTTSGYYGSFSLTNSTLSKIKGPVFRITHKLADDTKILVDHCTIDSIYGTTSPFYSSTTEADLTGNEVTITNTVLTNVFDCTSLWARLTIATPENNNIGNTSYWNVPGAVDSATATNVTLAASYVYADPMYSAYTEDVATRDFTITNATLLTAGTDGGKIGDLRWNSALTKKVAYITEDKTMDASAAALGEDDVVKMLQADGNFEVTVILTAQDGVVDLTGYDLVIAQEGFNSGSPIFKAGGSLDFATIPVPFIYNKTYALRDGKALTSGGGTAGESADGVVLTVDAGNQSNELFNGVKFDGDKSILFRGLTTDGGTAEGTKAINYVTGLTLSDANTMLGYVSNTTDLATSVVVNDIPAGTTIGDRASLNRGIFLGMNFGAISLPNNMTSSGLTIWRNAAYSLTGLTVPTDGVVVVAGTDATLSDLQVDGATVTGFDAATLSYDVSVAGGTTSVEVTATATDATATITGTGSLDVSVGSGSASVIVTAEDGTTSLTYTVNVTVASVGTDATLSDLAIDGTTVDGFASGTYSYNVQFDATTTSVEVTATPTDVNASVSGTGSVTIDAAGGTITVTVTAQDGTTTQDYDINYTVVGVDQNRFEMISIYPNPANTSINVSNATGAMISIYDLNGRMLKSEVSASDLCNIDLTDMSKGVYLIKIQLDNDLNVSRFIIE